MAYFRQSKRRTTLFLEAILNQPCYPVLTVKIQNQVTAALRPAYDELVATLPAQEQLSMDESPTKQGAAKAWLWTFVDVEGIEPTKRVLRHAVIWRKLSFGTQSAAGSRFVETTLSVIETCRQQDHNIFAYTTQTVQAHFTRQNPLSLPPQCVNGYDAIDAVGRSLLISLEPATSCSRRITMPRHRGSRPCRRNDRVPQTTRWPAQLPPPRRLRAAFRHAPRSCHARSQKSPIRRPIWAPGLNQTPLGHRSRGVGRKLVCRLGSQKNEKPPLPSQQYSSLPLGATA